MAQRLVEEYLMAEVSIPGRVHVEGGKLIVGDSDIATVAAEYAGLASVQGRVLVQVYAEPLRAVMSNPAPGGLGLEASEPVGGLG